MSTDAELYSALKYRVVVNPDTGTRRYYNDAGRLHRTDGPAIVYPYGGKSGTVMGVCTVKMALRLNGVAAHVSGGLMV